MRRHPRWIGAWSKLVQITLFSLFSLHLTGTVVLMFDRRLVHRWSGFVKEMMSNGQSSAGNTVRLTPSCIYISVYVVFLLTFLVRAIVFLLTFLVRAIESDKMRRT